MKTRVVAGLLLSILVWGAAATPASAETEGTAVFNGSASVGKWFRTVCDKNGVGIPTGRGLYYPWTVTVPAFSNGDDTREEQGVWQLTTTGTFAGLNQAGVASGPIDISVCGYLSAITPNNPNRFDGVGASCGGSKGHHGQGNVRFANGERIKLYEVGWKASAGGWLPVVGQYQEYADDQGDPNIATKKDKRGAFMGWVFAPSPAACWGFKHPAFNNGNGAQVFSVAGDLEFFNGIPAPEKEESKDCKDVGPKAGGDGVKKSHQNKPGTRPCNDEHGGEK